MRRVQRVLIAATVALAGCPTSAQPQAPHSPEEVARRLRVANDEARRGAGAAELVLMARGADAQERALALRGLARIGGADARAAITEALKNKEPLVVIAALDAESISAALDDPEAGIGATIAAAA